MKLRELPWLHRPLKWLRRTLLAGCHEAALAAGRLWWAGRETFGPPGRMFSVYQALRTGDPPVTGRIVLHDQGTPVVTPNSWLVRSGFHQHAEQPWPIFWSQHPSARLVGESLALLLPGKRLCLESVYGNHGYHSYPRGFEDPSARWFRLPPPVKLAGNWTSLISRWVPTRSRATLLTIPNHTHWLLDALPRLALMPELPTDTRILVPDRLAAYQEETLSLLGLRDRCRPTTEHHLEVDNYFFSSPTAMLDCFNPYAITFLREKFLPHRDRTFAAPKKFFIRRPGKAREADNIAEVEHFFAARGWTLVELEKLTFRQELQLFAEAEAITGLGGSGFTNVLFCNPGCRVIQICPLPPGLTIDGYLDWIEQVVKFEFHNLVVECPYSLRYNIDPQQLKRQFAALGIAL